MFETLHHGRLAALSIGNDGLFEYSGNGNIVSYYDAWKPYKIDNASDFVLLPGLAVIALMFIMLIFHIATSSCILKFALRDATGLTVMTNAYHTIITPPLHIDWELFYDRQKDDEKCVKKCWKMYVSCGLMPSYHTK